MTRLPAIGGDNGSWGQILNDFLSVEHNADGSLKTSGSLSSKANDSGVVHTTTDETIAGVKTFSSSPIVPTPTNPTDAANKTYVDSTAASGTPDATTTTKGKVQLAGDLGGTASSPTVPGLSSKVPTTRQVASGSGLTGGGDLSADRTLSVTYGTTSGTAAQGNDTRLPTAITTSTSVAYAISDQINQYGLAIFNDGSLGFSQLESTTAQRTATQLSSLLPSTTPTQYKSAYNSTAITIASGPDIIAMGDSLTAGAGGSGTTYATVLATTTGKTVRNSGVGGESSIGINARQGGQPYMLLPAGNQIPASGGVTVALSLPGGLTAWPLLQGTGTGGTMHGSLAGIPGVLTLTQPSNPGLTHNVTDYYTFTRDASGSAVTVNRPTAFYLDFNEARRGDIYIYWYGRNNLTATAQVVGDIASSILHQTAIDKRFLVLSVLNTTTETSGTSNYNSIIALNTQLQQTYGRRYVDVRSYLINYGLADANITATSQDTTDIANDCVPNSLHPAGDTIHLNSAGYTVVGNYVAARLSELGWL